MSKKVSKERLLSEMQAKLFVPPPEAGNSPYSRVRLKDITQVNLTDFEGIVSGPLAYACDRTFTV